MNTKSGESGSGLQLLICRLQVSSIWPELMRQLRKWRLFDKPWIGVSCCLTCTSPQNDWAWSRYQSLICVCSQLARLQHCDQDPQQSFQPLSCFSFNLPCSASWFFWVNWVTWTPDHSFLSDRKHTLLQEKHQGEHGVWLCLIITAPRCQSLCVCMGRRSSCEITPVPTGSLRHNSVHA